jgi:hypothetical protein
MVRSWFFQRVCGVLIHAALRKCTKCGAFCGQLNAVQSQLARTEGIGKDYRNPDSVSRKKVGITAENSCERLYQLDLRVIASIFDTARPFYATGALLTTGSVFADIEDHGVRGSFVFACSSVCVRS